MPPWTPKEKLRESERDLELWTAWKANPTEENLVPLMEQIRPLSHQRVHQFGTAPVPQPAVLASAQHHAMKGLQTYTPGKDTQLKTWIYKYLQGVHSDVSKHANIGRIPYRRSRQIGLFGEVTSQLRDELGYEPDTQTIAERMNTSLAEAGRLRADTTWTPAQVEKMRVDAGRADHIESLAMSEPDKLEDLQAGTRREVMRYIYQDLSPRERTVFEYQHGLYGRPQMNGTQTAKAMKISAPTVSRIRNSVQEKIDERMQRRGM
jgi:DNA-directed RNA polymerase specialized sigma subunit